MHTSYSNVKTGTCVNAGANVPGIVLVAIFACTDTDSVLEACYIIKKRSSVGCVAFNAIEAVCPVGE